MGDGIVIDCVNLLLYAYAPKADDRFFWNKYVSLTSRYFHVHRIIRFLQSKLIEASTIQDVSLQLFSRGWVCIHKSQLGSFILPIMYGSTFVLFSRHTVASKTKTMQRFSLRCSSCILARSSYPIMSCQSPLSLQGWHALLPTGYRSRRSCRQLQRD